mgnify:CR=1 FL=1
MKIQRKNSGMDMLRGSLSGNIIRFALPLAGNSMLQQLFNAADTAIVGRFDGRQALAAVGSNTMIISLFVNMFVGLSIGANVVIAKYVGQRQEEKIKKSVHTVMFLAVLSGLFLLVFGQMTAEKILTLMQTPEDVMAQAVLYLKIYCLGMPFMMVYNFGAAVLRCKGDTRCPLYALILSGILNVGLNLLLVVAFKMGVAGVGIATVIANGVSGSLVCCFLMQEKGSMHLSVKAMQLDKKYLKEVLQVGIPAGIQSTVINLSNALLQSSVNSFGSVAMAGYTAANNIFGFLYMSVNAVTQSCMSFTSQNYGVKKLKRMDRVLLDCMILSVGVTLTLGCGAYFFGPELLKIYTSDADVIRCGVEVLAFTTVPYFCCGIMDLLPGALRGMGYSGVPMILSIIGTVGTRIVWIFGLFPAHRSLSFLFISYPVSWILTILMQAVCFCFVRKHVHQSVNRDLA